MDIRAKVPVVKGEQRKGLLDRVRDTRMARPKLLGPARILYMNHGADLGGAEISLLELLRAIDRDRFEPLVLCPREGDFVSILRAESIPVQILPLQRMRELEPLPFLATVERVSALCWNLGIDLIHSNSVYAAQLGNVAGLRAGVSTVCHVREWLESEYGIASFMLDLADRTVCVSKTVLQRYLELGGCAERAISIYSGIRSQPWRGGMTDVRNELNIPPGASIVAFVGRVDPNKRPHVFLKVAERLSELMPDIHYVVAGGSFAEHSEYARFFTTELSRAALNGRFHRIGFRFDISSLLAESAALVFTSRHEGFPRVVIEAMLHRVPVVAASCQALDECIQDGVNGYLVREKSEEAEIEALTDRLVQVLRQGVPNNIRENAARTASRFSVGAHVQKMEALYEELLAERKEPACVSA